MENNTINTVNISLEEYNRLNNKLADTTALLSSAKASLEVLQQQEKERKNSKKDNKIIVVESPAHYDEYDRYHTGSRISYDISDPTVSNELLNIISKIDNSELTKEVQSLKNSIKTLENEKDSLSSMIDRIRTESATIERAHKAELRSVTDDRKEEIRKVKKSYEEQILDLEIEKETLNKALADLKVNKTQEQLELARQEELDSLKSKIRELQEFQEEVMERANKPFELRKFFKEMAIARKFHTANAWLATRWQNTVRAIDNVQAFQKVMETVGKKVNNNVNPINAASYYGKNISYVSW